MINPYAPYDPDALDRIGASHAQVMPRLTLTAGATVYRPAVLSGTLAYSEDWSPYGQVSLSCALTLSPAELAALDPRAQTVTVTLEAGYLRGDGTEDVHTLFAGYLIERTARSPEGVLDIRAQTRDGLAHEVGYLGAGTVKTWQGVAEAADWCAAYAEAGPVSWTSAIGPGHRPDLTAAVPLTPGRYMADVLQDLALGAALRIYADETGGWVIGPKSAVAGQVAAILQAGPGGIVTRTTDTLRRSDRYAGAAVVTYRWRDAAGADQTVTGTYGLPGAVTHSEQRDGQATQAQADAAARELVRGLSTLGDAYSADSVAGYWLRPGQTVQIETAGGTVARQIVKGVTFNLAAGTMTVSTRQPSNLGV